MTFDKGQQVRLANERRLRRVTSRLLTTSGEYYQLNYGAKWYGADELRSVFNNDLDLEENA